MKGTDFTFKALGDVAVEKYNLYSFGSRSDQNDGEFLSFEKDDVTRRAVHIHFYKNDLVKTENSVTIECHAIWAKSKEGWWRQKLTLSAHCYGEHWKAELQEGDVEFKPGEKEQSKFNPLPNEALKKELFERVVAYLTLILENTLNED